MSKSQYEDMLALHMRVEGVDSFLREYRFHPTRRWRFDFADKVIKLAVEVEGVTSYGKHLGRHQSAKGFKADCEKYDEAMRLGWNIYRCTQDMVKSGRAIETIKILIEAANERR